MTNNFQRAFQANLPQIIRQVVPADRLAALQNPQVLLTPDAMTNIQQGFAALGPQGNLTFEQLMQAIRASPASAITSIFAVAAIAMALGVLATLRGATRRSNLLFRRGDCFAPLHSTPAPHSASGCKQAKARGMGARNDK